MKQRRAQNGHDLQLKRSIARGAIIGASKIVRDISERKGLQDRLEETQSELLHVSRLNDMGQLTAGLAHELNQPLAPASSYLAATMKLSEAQEFVKAMEGCTKVSSQLIRAGEVIRRLRDFAKNAAFERRTEAVRPLLEEAVALVMMGTRANSVAVGIDVPPRQGIPADLLAKLFTPMLAVGRSRPLITRMAARCFG
jgi:two-component system sensor kinase FixL